MTLAVDGKSRLKQRLFYILGFVCLSVLTACSERQQLVQLTGSAMGTSWNVSIVPESSSHPADAELQRGIESILDDVNRSMSTYQEDSEISRFNAAAVNTWFPVSAEFYTVLSTALAVGFQSGGAYDVTVGPLVDLWGFGAEEAAEIPPAAETIAEVLQQIGPDQLMVDGNNQRIMKRGELSLDFSSLSDQGLDRYLVEIGGEMSLSGMSPRGDAWRIAIEQPISSGRSAGEAMRLSGVAVATSGDYRNFFEAEGRRYSHSIDPRSGYPVAHELVSVTVVERSAMLADAWATALLVLGPEEGMVVAQTHGLAVYFIVRQGQGYERRHTPGFAQFLEAIEQEN